MKDEVRFTLRIPKPLYDRASALANGAFMSLNGYVLAAINQVVEEEEYVPNPEEDARIRKSIEEVLGSNELMRQVMQGNAFIQALSSPKPIPQNTIEKEEK